MGLTSATMTPSEKSRVMFLQHEMCVKGEECGMSKGAQCLPAGVSVLGTIAYRLGRVNGMTSIHEYSSSAWDIHTHNVSKQHAHDETTTAGVFGLFSYACRIRP